MRKKNQIKRGINIFLFKRDLRLRDNVAFYNCLYERKNVLPIYIFQEENGEKLLNVPQQNFVFKRLQEVKSELEEMGTSLLILNGGFVKVFLELQKEYQIFNVYYNQSFDPFEAERENGMKRWLVRHGIECHEFNDHLIYKPGIVCKEDQTPYVVYTPYKKKWMERFMVQTPRSVCPQQHFENLLRTKPLASPTKIDLGIKPFDLAVRDAEISTQQLEQYEENRNTPAINGTTNLSVFLRFGIYSIRRMSRKAYLASESVLSEFIWREFFTSVLWHFPFSQQDSFKSKYDFIDWRNDIDEFELWSKGETGYPLVDAGMRELNQTGYMHNRVRMVVASFMCKHLLIDWRWGELYFASKLLDYERASNVGNWQWACGSGCDAMPYNRIFNPHTQLKRFDPDFEYCKKWIPELGTDKYPNEIIEHSFARERALKVFKQGLLEKS